MYTDGSEILAKNPQPAFDCLRGFTISHRIDQTAQDTRNVFVDVHHEGKSIAKANFSDDVTYFLPQYVSVKPEFRRQGIATAMYVFAETLCGKQLTPFRKDIKADEDAKPLWEQPNRPFGNSGKPLHKRAASVRR